MNNLHNIVVFIKDEAMLQEAMEMLIANGQEIEEWAFFIGGSGGDFIYNAHGNLWSMAQQHDDDDTPITLPELEQLLKQNRDETKR